MMKTKPDQNQNKTLHEYSESAHQDLITSQLPIVFSWALPTRSLSVSDLLPDQSTDLYRVYTKSDSTSLVGTNEIFDEISRFVPARLLHQELRKNLETYANLRTELAATGRILPKLELRLGSLGNDANKTQNNYASSMITSSKEQSPFETLTIDHWFNLEKIKADNVPVGSVVANELANMKLLLDVLNQGIKAGLSFDKAWDAALNTTSHPSFEIFTYSTDVGFARLREKNDTTFRTPWDALKSIPAETLVEEFNKAAEESALEYYRAYRPYLWSPNGSKLVQRQGGSDSNINAYSLMENKDPLSDPGLIINSRGVLFLGTSDELMRQHQERQLRLYTRDPHIGTTTRKIEVPTLGEITIPALKIRDTNQ